MYIVIQGAQHIRLERNAQEYIELVAKHWQSVKDLAKRETLLYETERERETYKRHNIYTSWRCQASAPADIEGLLFL